MPRKKGYTTHLGHGLGLVSETKTLFELWTEGMPATDLYQTALVSGRFPTMTARRLRNIVLLCFAPRYLSKDAATSKALKTLVTSFTSTDLLQLLLIFTCRANPILSAFIKEVYWSRYAGGFQEISNDDARRFIERSISEGKTTKPWAESQVRRMSGYLTGCCADYGFLEAGSRSKRHVSNVRLSWKVASYLAYELHFSGLGDTNLLTHPDWMLFGLERDDVLTELKRISLNGLIILQSAGDVVRISWKYADMEALCDVLTQS